MFSFLVLSWKAQAGSAGMPRHVELVRARSESLGYERAFDSSGLCVLTKGSSAGEDGLIRLGADRGVVLGTLFSWPRDNTPAMRLRQLSESQQSQVAESSGQELVKQYWGRYVAFIRASLTAPWMALRDPTGGLPCYFYSHGGVEIWFSRVHDLLDIGVGGLSINWKHIEAHVVFRAVQTGETGITGIRELLAGHRRLVGTPKDDSQSVWNPFETSQTGVIQDSGAAAALLQSTTKACVQAWAQCYSGVLHTLSGGLDSAVVLSCLHSAQQGPFVACVNYFTDALEGDERRYARLMATRAGVRLIEHRRSSESVDLRLALTIAASPKPWFYLYYIEHGDFEHQLARDVGATAIFSGGGGDGLFYQARALYSIADYIHHRGLSPGLIKVALDAARLEGKTLFGSLVSAVKLSAKELPAEQSRIQSLVSSDLVHALSRKVETALRDSFQRRTPPGKLWQIMACSTPHSYYEPFDRPDAVERVPPLVSQPIVEACLRTPTYILVEHGWDRSLARRAFASELPPEIVNRRGKGAIQDHVRRIFERNLTFIRELLLDGELVRCGLLDRVRLERCLQQKSTLLGAEFTEIQDHVSTEAWLTRWKGIEERREAA